MVTRNIMKFQAALIATSLLPLSAGFSTSTSVLASSQMGNKLDNYVSPQASAYSQVVRTTFPRKRSLLSMSTVTPGNQSPVGSDNTLFEPLGVGIKRDFKRRLPHYKSDITDGMNAQSLATILFLFFACLAPAIGFGGILDTATNGAMGAIEMVSSTAFCGVVYSLCAAQPIQLIGPMGPNLAFSISLFKLGMIFDLPFLPLYAWTGLWTGGMLCVASLTSASNMVKFLTPFTDEIFSVLISTIFIFEAISDISKPFASPISTTATKALLTLTCASVTFGSATVLKSLKNSVYFTKSIRNNLSNFAPAIGVAFGSLTARVARMKYGHVIASLPALSLPSKFATTSGRPWWIPLMDLPIWARWGACIPALLATVLLFLDQNITARLVNNPRYKMVKGRDTEQILDGMHGDMLVLSFLTVVTSMVGLPWMAGATTRSAAHVRSLSLFDEAGNIKGTIENRITGASIHALIGACVLFSWPRMLLSQVPLPVLSGVFMYLGLTSLQGLELWDRIRGLFQDSSVAPRSRWSVVPKHITRLFTVLQMTCVAAMMWVTKSTFGVISPLMIAVLPLIRAGLMKFGIITKEEMRNLDQIIVE